jgi:hypothetical protein
MAAQPIVEWRWDRFNVREVTSLEWAARNCVGRTDLTVQQAMHKKVIQDQKRAEVIITSELHQFLREAASITGMTYICKITQLTIACINSKDIRTSWLQDGSVTNLKRLAWLFYYYGSEIHKSGRSLLTHGEWVERKVLSALNVSYVHLNTLVSGQRTCVQQLYSKKMNEMRNNIMRRSPAFHHTSGIKKEQPCVPSIFKRNFKRGKSTFFVTQNIREKTLWNKVRPVDVELRHKYTMLTSSVMVVHHDGQD